MSRDLLLACSCAYSSVQDVDPVPPPQPPRLTSCSDPPQRATDADSDTRLGGAGSLEMQHTRSLRCPGRSATHRASAAALLRPTRGASARRIAALQVRAQAVSSPTSPAAADGDKYVVNPFTAGRVGKSFNVEEEGACGAKREHGARHQKESKLQCGSSGTSARSPSTCAADVLELKHLRNFLTPR